MTNTYSGRVLFANRLPAGTVQVRVIDPGNGAVSDVDFTTQPGLSDDTGAFTVSYDLSQTAGSPGSVEQYLQFRYQLAGQQKQHLSPLIPVGNEYRLPERSPIRLAPSTHGFKFNNSFVGYPLPFVLPALPGLRNVTGIYGLCGGMSSAVYDFMLAGRKIPETNIIPSQGDDLQRYLFKRQMDSFGTLGESILRFAEWMVTSDGGKNGAQQNTLEEFTALRDRLERGSAVLLGIVYVDWHNGFQLWKNHQVLAYDYGFLNSKTFEIRIYDPNYAMRDDITIRAERVIVHTTTAASGRNNHTYGLKCSQWRGAQKITDVRGFFIMPYSPVMPPDDLI